MYQAQSFSFALQNRFIFRYSGRFSKSFMQDDITNDIKIVNDVFIVLVEKSSIQKIPAWLIDRFTEIPDFVKN